MDEVSFVMLLHILTEYHLFIKDPKINERKKIFVHISFFLKKNNLNRTLNKKKIYIYNFETN